MLRRELRHVRLVLLQRHRQGANVVVVLEEERGTDPAGIREPVHECGRTNQRATDDLAVTLVLQQLQRGFDDRKRHSQARRELDAPQVAPKVQSLGDQLQDEIADKQVKLDMADRGLVITFVAEVLFDSGKAELKSTAIEALDKVGSVIKQKVADRDIGIEGHTDNQPIRVSGWKSNWELSTARAISVLHSLENAGVKPNRMVASGYGEYRPVVSNDDASGRSKNRRVEIVILPKKLTKRQQEIVREAAASGEPDMVAQAKEFESYK